MKTFLCRMILAVGLLLVVGSSLALADTATAQPAFDKRRLLVQPRNADGTIEVTPFFQDPVLWARAEQQNFYGAMSQSIKAIQGENAWAAALSLMLLSFGYGVLHAAGPGHGKAVISAWLLATENELKRGVIVAGMSAFVQAMTAIVVVSALLLLVSGAGTAARNAGAYLEQASYLLIAGMGAYLFWSAFGWRLPRRVQTAKYSTGVTFEIVNPLSHDHLHGPDCDCGHVPKPKDVVGDWSWSKAFSLAFAVGIRPCTGALLVLIFANALGLYWAGIASTFAMALGTFITVSVVAAIAVYSKKLAERLAHGDSRLLGYLGTGLRIVGGLGIIFFGLVMFFASLGGQSGL